MHVARIGFTPVKGARHRTHASVSLTREGPQGDRVFCLVDPVTDRCLRTVENPTLLRACASWDGTVLSVDLPSGTVAGEPGRTGEVRRVDYWGRATDLEVVQGPWAAAYSAHLGRDVVLAAGAPGAVVYGGAVTLVTSASLARLAEEVGAPVDGARFRATFELDSGEVGPHVEEEWVGRRLRIGTAEVRVRRVVQRCAVIDLDPASGVRDLGLLAALARYWPARGEVAFGLDAEVTVPGEVGTGDRAVLGRP
ncbi:MOSC domain-containing protein [Nocardioides sp. GXQ0305]|uniref:MOSC domain-containing protein n=1 Tax=Nocardioides sp. GXQ0305 TaxID=3423912 RepID=UPI003D7D4833